MRPIYLIPGMTREYPIFSRLAPLLPNAKVQSFLPPRPKESLASYAGRMAQRLTADAYIVGVSFGGIVAVEVSRVLQPRGCVVISSIRSPSQLPPWFRVLRRINPSRMSSLIGMIGKAAVMLPNCTATRSTLRARKLHGESGDWHRWATSSVLAWQPEPVDFPMLQIHGNRDTTFPIRYVVPDVCVENGTHSLPISHPQATADAILSFVNTEH